MNYFTNQRLLVWLVIILVILNICTLTTFWVFGKKFHRPLEGKHGAGCIEKFLAHELNFSKDQEEKLLQSDRIYFPKIGQLFNNIEEQKMKMSEQIFAPRQDTLFIDSLIRNIGVKEAEIERLIFYHLKELNSICDKKQQEKLKFIHHELLQFTAPEGCRMPPPPGSPGCQDF